MMLTDIQVWAIYRERRDSRRRDEAVDSTGMLGARKRLTCFIRVIGRVIALIALK